MPYFAQRPRHTRLALKRHPYPGSQVQFYLIYASSLICLMASGWAATLFH